MAATLEQAWPGQEETETAVSAAPTQWPGQEEAIPNQEEQWPGQEDKPFFNLADTASALVDVGRGIVASTPAAARTLWEGLERPDKWSPDTIKALEADKAFQREMLAKTEANQAAGTSSSVGETLREVGSSAGSSIVGMAAAIPAALGGAYLTRSKLGANLAGGLAGGTAAYRMAGARFLNDSFKDWQTQEEQRLGRPVTEPEKEAAYQELLPLAQNAGLWEAGPEAIGNMATLGAGKVILGLGKNRITALAKGSLAKLGIKAGAAAGAIGTELATETVTQVGQGLPQAQAEAIAANQDPALAQSAYPVTVEGVTQAFKDVAPQTLALSGLMMGAAGGVRLATRPFRNQPEADQAATPPPLPTPPAPTAPAATITLNGQAYTYNPNELTPAALQTIAATGNLQDYLDAGMLQNATPQSPLPPPDLTSGLTDLGTVEGDLLNDARFRPPPQAQAPFMPPPDLTSGLTDLGTVEGDLLAQVPQNAPAPGQDAATVPNDQTNLEQSVVAPTNPADIKRGDRFIDDDGNTWEVWKSRQGTVEAHPVIDGKPVVNNQTTQRWATTPESRTRNPADRTDMMPEGRTVITDPTDKQSLTVQGEAQTALIDAVIAQESQDRGLRPPAPGTVSRQGSALPFEEIVGMAAAAIRSGVTNFSAWATAMIRRFGESVRQYLAGAWQAAKKNSEVGARANLNPNSRLSARPPTMAEAIDGQTRDSQFGERVQADERLTEPVRTAPVSTFAIQNQQQALDAANALIRDLGLEGATAQFSNDASLPMPVRIAGLMQAALQYDARAALAQRQGNETASATADAATQAAIEAKSKLEVIGNETGRNLAMFNTWNRMSPDGQLRRAERQLTQGARDTVYGDQGVTPEEVTRMVEEETNSPAIDDLIEQIILESAAPSPVNLQTGAPIARRSLLDTFLGGLETTARAISESTTVQRAVEAIDNVLKALSGKLFADPLLITPIGQAVLKTTRTLLLQGVKLTQAIADAIAVVRTRISIPQAQEAPLAQAVTAAVVKEIIRPILRKLAFDPNYNKREATKDLLAIGIGVMEAGRLADAVIAKRPKIAKTAQAKVREAVMRRLSDKPRARSRKQKLPGIIDTLVLASGAGFINERTFLDAWDKKHPLPKLTAADRQRLRKLAAEINLLPEGILRQAKAIEFQNAVALIEGIPAADAILSAWYANLLAGLSTQGVNVWGNGLHLFFRTLAQGLGTPADVSKLMRGLAAGVRPGLREAKQVLKSGQLLKVNKMDDMQASAALELMTQQGGPKGFGQWLAYVMSVGGLTRFVFRAMGAMDAVFWYSAQEGQAHLAVSRALRKGQGLKPGTVAFNAEFIRQLGGDETQFLADLDQARTELAAAGVTVTSSAVNRRAYEIRQQRRSLDVRDASVRWADRMTFQQQPEGIGATVSSIISLLQKFRPAGVPVFIPLVPFNRILANLFESSLDWAGVGILRGIVGSHLTDMKNKDRRMFDTAERRERFMAGVLGMGIAGTLLAAAMALKDMDDDEVPFMIYAMGPPDPTRRGTMPKNWRPFTIKIRGQYVGYAESPMGPLLGAVGAYLDDERYSKRENKTQVERGIIASQAALSSFMSMGVMSSLKDITDLWGGQGGTRGLKQVALSPVAGFVPAQGLLRDMAPIFDSTKISDGDIFGALVKDIPVLKSYGRPALNVLGEEIQIGGLPIVRRFVTPQQLDPNITFIQNHKLRITALERTIEIGKYLETYERGNIHREENDRRIALGMTALENGVMTPAQQYQFTRAQGAAIKGGLERLRVDAASLPRSPETTAMLQKQLDRTVTAARKTAMRELISELR